MKKMEYSPVSRLPMITSSPYLAFFQSEDGGTTPSFSNPRKLHECVVCSFLALFKNTDTTSGCSALIKKKIKKPLAETSILKCQYYNQTWGKTEETGLKDLSSLLLLIDQLFNNEIQECMT